MKRILTLAVAAALSLSAAGCTKEQLEANMAYARQVADAIKQGAAVTAAAVRQGIDAACANQAAVGLAYQTTRSVLIQQVGPNTTKNIDRLDRAMISYTNVCAAASNPQATNLTALLSAALAAYAEVKAAQRAAGVQ